MGCTPIIRMPGNWPSSISPPMTFFLFGLTMITPSLIVRVRLLHHKRFGTATRKEKVEKVEIFKTDGIYRYIYQNDMLIADVEAGEHENYFMVEEEGQEPKY